jgi:hypothetical protein
VDHQGIEFTVVRVVGGGWKCTFQLPGKRLRTKEVFGDRDYAIKLAKQEIDRALGVKSRPASTENFD